MLIRQLVLGPGPTHSCRNKDQSATSPINSSTFTMHPIKIATSQLRAPSHTSPVSSSAFELVSLDAADRFWIVGDESAVVCVVSGSTIFMTSSLSSSSSLWSSLLQHHCTRIAMTSSETKVEGEPEVGTVAIFELDIYSQVIVGSSPLCFMFHASSFHESLLASARFLPKAIKFIAQ